MNYLKVIILAVLVASCGESSETTQDKEVKESMSRIDSLKELRKQNEIELKELEMRRL
jgi:hypothetical protein